LKKAKASKKGQARAFHRVGMILALSLTPTGIGTHHQSDLLLEIHSARQQSRCFLPFFNLYAEYARALDTMREVQKRDEHDDGTRNGKCSRQGQNFLNSIKNASIIADARTPCRPLFPSVKGSGKIYARNS
jgi:hypothetical protein